MPTKVALRHHTAYRYEPRAILGPQLLRLRPAPHARTPISAYALTVVPEPQASHWFYDVHGNSVARFFFGEPVAALQITVELHAELAEINPFDFFLEPEAATWPFRYAIPQQQELAAFRIMEPIQPWLPDLLAGLPVRVQPTLELLTSLNQHLSTRIAYVTRMEPGIQDPADTAGRGSGSCRDVAYLFLHVARSLGFAARFASGYLIQLADPEGPTPESKTDRADLHAWAEVFLPGAGWIGFDATSGMVAGAGHIPLAWAAHPASAAPITGTVEAGTRASFDVDMTITRLA